MSIDGVSADLDSEDRDKTARDENIATLYQKQNDCREANRMCSTSHL